LAELFEETHAVGTPFVVKRIGDDIDEIVRVVRFPDCQRTIAGERQVKQALRKTLYKYRLHTDQDLFDRAYAHVRECYWEIGAVALLFAELRRAPPPYCDKG